MSTIKKFLVSVFNHEMIYQSSDEESIVQKVLMNPMIWIHAVIYVQDLNVSMREVFAIIIIGMIYQKSI